MGVHDCIHVGLCHVIALALPLEGCMAGEAGSHSLKLCKLRQPQCCLSLCRCAAAEQALAPQEHPGHTWDGCCQLSTLADPHRGAWQGREECGL